MRKGKRLLVLSIVLIYVCMAAACSTNDSAQGNKGSGSSLAGNNSASQAENHDSSQAKSSGSRQETGTDNSAAGNIGSTVPYTEGSENGSHPDVAAGTGESSSLLEDAGNAVNGALDDIGNAVGNVARDLTGNGSQR